MAAGATLQILGLDKLLAGFRRAQSTLPKDTRSTMERSLLRVESGARGRAPRRTGRLAGSITHRISGSGGNIVGEVGPSVQYGLYVETGTRPHWMPPGILPFPVMRHISIHGTRPHPYLVPAFSAALPAIQKDFDAIGIKVVQEIAG